MWKWSSWIKDIIHVISSIKDIIHNVHIYIITFRYKPRKIIFRFLLNQIQCDFNQDFLRAKRIFGWVQNVASNGLWQHIVCVAVAGICWVVCHGFDPMQIHEIKTDRPVAQSFRWWAAFHCQDWCALTGHTQKIFDRAP